VRKEDPMADTGSKQPRVIDWQGGESYRPILNGVPETHGMRSGRVELAQGEEIGEHSTKDHEETLVVLDGSGVVHVEGHEPLAIRGGQSVYIPPQSTHNVRNPESPLLRYIYVVVPVAGAGGAERKA
jgi:mannose-6-phosphate isomerase-like protein (cupin superfamily)